MYVGEVLEKSVVEKWWRRGLWRRLEKSVVEKIGEECCGEVLKRSVGPLEESVVEKCRRSVLERRVEERCCREECWREVL